MTTATTGDVPQDVASEQPVTHEWTVIKRRDLSETSPTQNPVWDQVGVIESEFEYSLPFFGSTLDQFARLGGAGEYLCICGQRCERVTIAADTVYRRVEES